MHILFSIMLCAECADILYYFHRNLYPVPNIVNWMRAINAFIINYYYYYYYFDADFAPARVPFLYF